MFFLGITNKKAIKMFLHLLKFYSSYTICTCIKDFFQGLLYPHHNQKIQLLAKKQYNILKWNLYLMSKNVNYVVI